MFVTTASIMAKVRPFLFLFSLVLLITVSCEYSSALKDIVRVGVVLDLNSWVGSTAKCYMQKAHSDCYAENANYQTQLLLVFRDSQNDSVNAASAALDLMKNEEVQAIVGPQKSSQAKFVIELGKKANVPIISFSATSPSLSPTENEFFVRTAHSDSFQVKAIADIVKAYGWRDVIPIYEDTEYGNGLIPYLIDALQEVNTRVPYRSVISPVSNDTEIEEELKKLKTKKTTIFLVHMTPALGSKLFLQAKKTEMMSEGYAWIVTEGLSNFVDHVVSEAMNSMEGVLGLRPLPNSRKKFELLKSKWMKSDKQNGSICELNLFGMWAYDTVWAIAMAVEKAGTAHSSYIKPNTSDSAVDISDLGRFKMGRKLLDTLLNTRFEGLSGNFTLVDGQLQPSVFEIFNVVRQQEKVGGEREKIIGYWTAEEGLIPEQNSTGKAVNSTLKSKLKQPTWPGNTQDQPKKLRIGVPVKKGFNEYIKVGWQANNYTPIISGFSADMFKKALEVLEFPLSYEFVPFAKKNHQSAGTYNELLHEIKEQKFDAAVGDITITANRSTYVDFTLPYAESSVSMVVLAKDENKNFWIFLKPLSWNLWLTTVAAFIYTGLVVWVLEHRLNTEFRTPPHHQVGAILWFSFSTLVFAHRERVENNWSKFVLIIWIFVVLILTQSYTASLTSMLTVQRLHPSFDDVKEIQRRGCLVGYQKDSFLKDLLINQLNFNASKLKGYDTPKEYDRALSKYEVAAIFDEIPFLNLFLAEYCSKYMMVGPTYRTGGLGFAFPQGSPLVSYISRAILNVTQDPNKLNEIERSTLGRKNTCEGHDSTRASDSLSLYSFGGLFSIAGIASMSSLLIYIFCFVRSHWPVHPERSFRSKIADLIKHF